MRPLTLDLLQTLSLAAVVYFVGIALRKRVGWLERLNIPAAVIGGLLFTLFTTIARQFELSVQLDTSTQTVLSVAFFTSIGMGASVALLKRGGVQLVVFLIFATAFCFVQNFVGMGIASAFGEHPLLGVMAGAVTLVGGPATGQAFAPLFEEAGLTGAGAPARVVVAVPGAPALTAAVAWPLAVSAAGMWVGGLPGNPVATLLPRRLDLLETPPSSPSAGLERELAPPPMTLLVEVAREDKTI